MTQVQFGKSAEWPENVREQDFIVNQPKQYPRARIKRSVNTGAVTYLLTHLPADTSVTLHVRVLTKYYVGPPSDVLEFRTKEGGKTLGLSVFCPIGHVCHPWELFLKLCMMRSFFVGFLNGNCWVQCLVRQVKYAHVWCFDMFTSHY